MCVTVWSQVCRKIYEGESSSVHDVALSEVSSCEGGLSVSCLCDGGLCVWGDRYMRLSETSHASTETSWVPLRSTKSAQR